MRILGFQTDLSLLNRYPPFVQMIARNVQEFHLCYLRGELEEKSIIFHQLKFPKIIQTSTILLAFLTALKSFKLCRKYGIDLIYIMDAPYYELSGMLTSALSRIPFVLRFRTNEVKLRSILPYNYVRRILGGFITRTVATRAKHIVCISHELRNLVLTWGVDPLKINVIYHGVNADVFRPLRVEKPFSNVVLFVGGFLPGKGSSTLLEAAKCLEDVHFFIVGSRSSQEILRMPKNIHSLGIVKRSRMPYYYNMSDVLVLASLSEGMPDTILEAFACGRPVIATKVGEIPRIVSPKFGWLIKPEDDQQLKETIQEALSDRKRLETMGKAARKFVVNNFRWSLYAKSMIEIMGKCVR